MGDLNVNILKSLTTYKHKDSDDSIYLLSSYNYQQLTNKHTRFNKNSSTLIDNIFTNYPLDSAFCTTGIICTDITDHFPVFAMMSQLNIKNKITKTVTRSNLKKENFTKCKIQFMEGIWDPIFNIDCPQNVFTYFQSTFLKEFNNNFPIEAVDIKYRNNLSWVTKSLAKIIKKKKELYYVYLADPSDCNNSNYKTYKNKLNSILRNEQRKYHSDQLELHRSNPLTS